MSRPSNARRIAVMLLIAALAIVLPASAAPCCGAMAAMQRTAPMMSHPCCAPHCTMKVGGDSQHESSAVLSPASSFHNVLTSSDVVTCAATVVASNGVANHAIDSSPPGPSSPLRIEQLRI